MKRLEHIGFKWEIFDHNKAFEQRCRDVEAFKIEFGFFGITQEICHMYIRCAYNQINRGKST